MAIMISGSVTRQGPYADKKDICELYIDKDCSHYLPHEHRKKKIIIINIGTKTYEAGVHETEKGVVWISSVLYEKYPKKEKVRLVDALATIGLRKGDRVQIKTNNDGTFSIMH
jgi:hypothetical protein